MKTDHYDKKKNQHWSKISINYLAKIHFSNYKKHLRVTRHHNLPKKMCVRAPRGYNIMFSIRVVYMR